MASGFDSEDSLFFRVSRQPENFQEESISDGVAGKRHNLDGVVSGSRQLRQPLAD